MYKLAKLSTAGITGRANKIMIKKKQDNYEVGYRKPPKNTQFQKGVSGNPKGRPKKAADFLSIFMKESESLIPINEDGRRDLISKQEAVIKQLTNKAMTGNIPATRIYFD